MHLIIPPSPWWWALTFSMISGKSKSNFIKFSALILSLILKIKVTGKALQGQDGRDWDDRD
jgi:hypothetical protein